MKTQEKPFAPACPLPASEDGVVTLAHGAGGRLMHRLVDDVFRRAFAEPALDAGHDGAVLAFGEQRLAMTTDSFVVRPLFFPGGDIGSLAVHGTVNDLAMCGARPLYLSCAFIIEEGLPVETLRRVADSMARAAREAGARLVTGDTKVVERGKADGLYVNTAGVGLFEAREPVLPSRIRPGDVLLLSGGVGAHGAAILSVREGLSFETKLLSDSACVWPEVAALLGAGVDIHCLRDLTRGGLATAVNELAQAAKVGIEMEEASVPVACETRAACELFGLDPLYMACEGRFAAFVPAAQEALALETLRAATEGRARSVGRAVAGPAGRVRLRTALGVDRILDMLEGEPLPRIC